MVRFGPRDSVPEHFGNRVFHVHNDLVTLMRTSPEECLEIGRVDRRPPGGGDGSGGPD